jgi:HK97 family phage major capsid protein
VKEKDMQLSNDQWDKFSAAVLQSQREASDQLNEMKQKIAAQAAELLDLQQQRARGGGFGGGDSGEDGDALARLILESEGGKALLAKSTPRFSLKVPSHFFHAKTVQNVPGVNLSVPYRAPRLVAAPEQRLTIRSQLTAVPVSSASVEVLKEQTYTDATDIQGDDSSPENFGEGSLLPKSDANFTVTTVPIPTIGAHIKASEQALGDQSLLQRHINNRLIYHANLHEEAVFLTGAGTGLTPSGINDGATAFVGGSTNLTRLDALEKMANQLAVANYSPQFFVLHPNDWSTIRRSKDSEGRYILGDPAAQTAPMAWGLPVIVTSSQTEGNATVCDGQRLGYIADRQEADVMVGYANDDFTRLLVTIRVVKRSLLVIELAAAAVYGALDYAG